MKNKFLKLTALSLIASSAIYANGYKIPETSVNSTALLAANVAHASGTDTAYFNPANMAFMKDENSIDASLMLIAVDSTTFKGSGYDPKQGAFANDLNIESEGGTPLIPSLHFVSSKYDDFRFGFSMVVPSGVTKKWEDSPAKDFAEQFTLEVIELNPSVAYKINDQLAVAFGARLLSSSGIVKSTSAASRDMEGSGLDFGYNLALAYKPTSALEIGVAYRSEVTLSEEGNAKLYVGESKVYDGGSSVKVPLPAQLNLAMAYTFESKTTLEVVFERDFWSAYETLDFNYDSNIPAIIQSTMDSPKAKNWEDTTTIRIGATQELDNLKLMAGFTISKTPVPEATVSYELPGRDATYLSAGFEYQIDEKLSAGFAALYSMKEDLTVSNDTINGEFSDGQVFIVTTGISYKF